MKKVFALMAIAAMTLVACNKPNNEDDPGQEGGDEKEYVAQTSNFEEAEVSSELSDFYLIAA